MKKYSLAWIFLLLSTASFCQADLLTTRQRDSLRYHLQNQYNEVSLLIKNRRVDESDMRRQEREMNYLKVYDRIPMKDSLPELETELRQTAPTYNLKVISLRLIERSRPQKIPDRVTTDSGFRLVPQQIVETLWLQIKVKGDLDFVRNWIKSWPENLVRVITPKGGQSPRLLRPGIWQIDAESYRFRDVRYPILVVRDPQDLLPNTVQGKLARFSQEEPLLQNLIKETQALLPKTPDLYRKRGEFFLNQARYNFFLSKTRDH